MFDKIFGKNKSASPYNHLKVVFHKDANPYGEHGTIYADHVQHGLVGAPVRFAFVAKPKTDTEPNLVEELVAVNPPNLTASLLAYITEEAEKQGYIVHCMRSYANIFTVQPPPNLNYLDIKSNSPDGRAPRQGVSRSLRRPSGERAQQAATNHAR